MVDEKDDLSEGARKLGLVKVPTAFVLAPEKQKAMKRTAAGRKAAQRERDLEKGIRQVGVKIAGDREKQIINRLAKASVDGDFDAVLDEITAKPHQESAPQHPKNEKRSVISFVAGLLLGAALAAIAL